MVRLTGKLLLIPTEDGGRATPISSGFRTDLRFDESQFRMVAIDFKKELLFPGESTPAICHVLVHSDEEIRHLVELGKTTLEDGPHVIGLLSDIARSEAATGSTSESS